MTWKVPFPFPLIHFSCIFAAFMPAAAWQISRKPRHLPSHSRRRKKTNTSQTHQRRAVYLPSAPGSFPAVIVDLRARTKTKRLEVKHPTAGITTKPCDSGYAAHLVPFSIVWILKGTSRHQPSPELGTGSSTELGRKRRRVGGLHRICRDTCLSFCAWFPPSDWSI